MFTYIAYIWRFIVFALAIQVQLDKAQPGVPHAALARHFARMALELDPDAPERVAGILEAHARQESSFGLRRDGDSHQSWGMYQIFGRPDLEWDDDAAAREAWRQTLVGLQECPKAPFSMYLSGKCILEGRVRHQADARMRLARQYEKELQ